MTIALHTKKLVATKFLAPVLLSLVALASPCVTAIEKHNVAWESKFNLLPQDTKGWSRLTPSSDSRIIYVSSSSGNSSGAVYSAGAPEIGGDPFNPSGPIKAYSSISAAMANTRQGYPDFVLLKRGDTWQEANFTPKGGRSNSERSVLGYYGTSTARPVVNTGTDNALRLTANASYSAIVGIKFSAHKRNPNGSAFAGFNSVGTPTGFYGISSSDLMTSILIEDCHFDWYEENAIQSSGPTASNIVIRRNIISNSYNHSGGHSQGIYSKNTSILLEENFFDHNGWYKQSKNSDNSTLEGQATIFNHNTYFAEVNDTIFRNNVFLRASSIGSKFTSNPEGTDSVKAWNILLDNNLYVDGELGISIGGNTDNNNGSRWRNIVITNNVFSGIGDSRSTNRGLAWGLEIHDWDGGLVKGNVFSNFGDPDNIRNVYAVSANGHTRNVSYTGNIVYNLMGNPQKFAISLNNGSTHKNVSFTNNQIQPGSMSLVDYELDSTSTLSGNIYYTSVAPSSSLSFKGSVVDFSGYVSGTGEKNSSFTKRNYLAPNRTVQTYMSQLGYTGSVAELGNRIASQSKFSWNEKLTANAINDYIRNGFCVDGQGCSLAVEPDSTPPNPPLNLNIQVQ